MLFPLSFIDQFVEGMDGVKRGNGCRIYRDIMTGENLSSIKIQDAISPVIYWSVHSSSRRDGWGKVENGCRIYLDIMTGEKLSSIYVAIYPRIYWSGHLFSRREGDGEIVILTHYRVHFIIEHENLVYDPSNNKSINVNIL